MKIRCDWCGVEFERKTSQMKKHNYCSRACFGKANAERFKSGRIKICDQCGKPFEYLGHHTGRNKHFFCSKKCSDEFRNKHIEVECDLCGIKFMKKRSDAAWTEHNFCCEDCYRTYIALINVNKKGLHYDGKPIYRILMENQLGRELTPDEEVHHIDGNHFNNALENLVVLSKSEHSKIHASWKERNENGQFKGGDEE